LRQVLSLRFDVSTRVSERSMTISAAPALPPSPRHAPTLLAITASGFMISAVVWTAWFITHIPWTGVASPVSLFLIAGSWVAAAAWSSSAAGPARGPVVGLGGGLLAAAVGLLLLGSKIAHLGDDSPAAPLIIAGFLATGAFLGGVGGLFGNAIGRSGTVPTPWLFRLAVAAAACAAPLLFVGGLVTSTDSGMAVPDWPNTFGSNMFLYPLTGAATDIFLEHSHRLFGTLVGLATLALMGWTLAVESRRWVKAWAVGIFAFICLQGVLGGSRVLADSRAMAMIHGISAQVIFAGIVALATFLSPAFGAAADGPDGAVVPKRVRVVVTSALHAVLLQLVFGALYRHTRSTHALWTHAVVALLVLALVAVAGFMAIGVRRAMVDGPRAPLARALATSGWWLVAVVGIQFLLGWVAFFIGGREREAASIAQALIRTAHQANGALLLTVVTAATVMAKRLSMPPARAGGADSRTD